MKTLSATMLSVIITATQALAYAGRGENEGMGLLTTFLIAFAVLIILFQMVPGLSLFVGMLKGVFSSQASRRNKGAVAGK